MKTILIYYSYSGKTKAFAEKKAQELGAKACQVMEKKRRSIFNAYVFGSHAAMRQKQSDIIPLEVDLMDYDKIIIAGPIWAGMPAPAVNSIIAFLPQGKDIELYFTSGSGKSNGQEKVKNLILERGCSVSSYHDIKESEIGI